MSKKKNMENIPMTWGVYEKVRALDTELQYEENKRNKVIYATSLILISLLTIIGIAIRINSLQDQILMIQRALI